MIEPDAPPRAWRIALVHDWLTGMRGGEKVLDLMCELYPDAELFTLVHVPGSVSPRIERRVVHTSIAQRLPGAHRYYRQYLPVFPFAVEQWDLDRFDLVISSSHCAAKAVVKPGRARHLCYCHTPMRYAWDQFEAYFGAARVGRARHAVLRRMMSRIARWDAGTAGRVDRFVANSAHVAGRIRRYYNRVASVVHPPVDTDFFTPDSPVPGANASPGAGFLIVSALVPYKRLEVALAACATIDAPLRIVGQGPDLERLRRSAGPKVEFLGHQSDEELRRCYRACTAVLLPGEEDFGIVPLEAQACGRPVVALGRGGALETVVDGITGVLVDVDSVDGFAAGLERVRQIRFDPNTLREHALRFSRDTFRGAIAAMVEDLMSAPEAEVRW